MQWLKHNFAVAVYDTGYVSLQIKSDSKQNIRTVRKINRTGDKSGQLLKTYIVKMVF
ncbi:MAG: hypothetical protein ACFFCZ_21570 [Promethearchaeota archaeon]